MKFKVLLIILIFWLMSCTKEDPLDPESDNTYTIEGDMYDQDGVTPLKNYPLNIVADKGQSIGGGSDYDYPDQTTTDENGFFKLSYRGNSSYSSLWIGQPSSITPVYGPFLTGIPANKNIERDICIVPKSNVKLIIESNVNLGVDDTVFVFGPELVFRSFTHQEFSVPKTNTRGIYLLKSDLPIVFDSLELFWNGSYSKTHTYAIFGIGHEDFLDTRFRRKGNGSYNTLSIDYTGFPETYEFKLIIE